MHNSRFRKHLLFEPLEGRTLLAATPWGGFPQLIDQDLAAANFPQ
jgi:hypothetical protein